jgi:hypothetical protein
VQISRISQHPESLSKTEVFVRSAIDRKVRTENALNLSRNAFLISASQKVSCRLSFERVYAKQTDKDRSNGLAGQSATPHCKEGRASTFDATRCRAHDIETDAHRLRPRFDGRPEPCLAAGCLGRSRMRQDFHRANVGRGDGSASLARRPRIRAQRRHANCVGSSTAWRVQ